MVSAEYYWDRVVVEAEEAAAGLMVVASLLCQTLAAAVAVVAVVVDFVSAVVCEIVAIEPELRTVEAE